MNTLFLRLESHLQAYPVGERYETIRTSRQPTKSAVMGMLAACFGIPRRETAAALVELNSLQMAVRVDDPGTVLTDYQFLNPPVSTAAGGVRSSQGGKQLVGNITRREYIADGSFLVALRGDTALLGEVVKAVKNPNFNIYLGRSFCVPYENPFVALQEFNSLEDALATIPATGGQHPTRLAVIERQVPGRAVEYVHDVLTGCDPFLHAGRLVERVLVPVVPAPEEEGPPPPPRTSPETKETRRAHDQFLCVVCKMGAQEYHHVTYERYGRERLEDGRSLCIACHRAVTMLEYTWGMFKKRIDPLNPALTRKILELRDLFV